ncbi:hypothetical protein I8748_33285 [Nostoc sp. CENA67]|uniref:Uncharacterized protein n=1 Tax=Amazonocrinis nigriterrae CENA67 TaxID=2794033 RepID=A0A8J7LCM7_9NOST|nr:DUF6615 family protein [Amazonocrinis nigriterrae]MBH8566965.1 hypothetical protein [Amazonocrinis nigriterrae CENA67]
MRPTLCDTFKKRSSSTWNMLAKGRSVDCQIGEQTLTDINILQLKISHSSEIYNHTFSTNDEGLYGADWEWWFTDYRRKKWLGFLVQAKVIDFDTNSFKHLHYRKNSSSLYQCELLIKHALESQTRLIPLYCFYSNWYANYYPEDESYGCSILSAFAVRYLQSKKSKPKNLKFLLKYMTPWDKLVCCDGNQLADLPSRVLNNWKNLIRPIEEEIVGEIDETNSDILNYELPYYRSIYNNIQLLDKPPEYVQLLLDNELVDQPNLNPRTLTVFQERDRATDNNNESMDEENLGF